MDQQKKDPLKDDAKTAPCCSSLGSLEKNYEDNFCDNGDIEEAVPYCADRYKSSQKQEVYCAAFCVLLAIAVFAMALTSSLKKPAQLPSGKHGLLSDIPHGTMDSGGDENDAGVPLPEEDWPQQGRQPSIYDTEWDDDEVDVLDLVEISYFPHEAEDQHANDGELPYSDNFPPVNQNEAEVFEFNDSAEDGMGQNLPAQKPTWAMFPEDCEGENCESILPDKESSSFVDDEGDPLPLYQGPVSDFIFSNMTRVGANSKARLCSNPGDGHARFVLDTDRYPWETSWSIKRLPNKKLYASGPPPGKNYARNTRYQGVLCLPAGRYDLVMSDTTGDGHCCTHGRGRAEVFVNGKNVVKTGSENYKVKRYGFVVHREVAAQGSTNGNTGGNQPAINNGQECSVVTPINYPAKFQHGANKYQSFPGYQCYRTVEGTKQTVNELLSKYPSLTSKITLPYPTSEKGQRLYAFVITNKRFNPKSVNPSYGDKGKLMVVGGIHARELSTTETIMRFAEYLLQNYGKDPDVTWILDYMEIHLIPNANPDGRVYLEQGGEKNFWKKNRNNSQQCKHWRYGVDPNRNFPFKWGKCDASDGSQRCSSSADCSSVVYRGPRSQSEAETKAIVQYAKAQFPFSQRKGNLQMSEARYKVPFAEDSEGVFVDMHSHGQYIGYPWGFKNEKTPNDDGLGALGRKFASFSGYKLWAPGSPNRVYGFDGGTIDTMYGWLGVASYFFELGTSFYQPCNTYPNVIREIFPALLYAAKVAKEPYKAPRGPDVLCTTITSTSKNDGKYINAKVEVSDNARSRHADDGGGIFTTGKQNVRSVEIFVNCHPYSGASCNAAARKSLPDAGKTTTLTLQFKAPVNRRNNIMYIRAKDSHNYKGPVTARKFVS